MTTFIKNVELAMAVKEAFEEAFKPYEFNDSAIVECLHSTKYHQVNKIMKVLGLKYVARLEDDDYKHRTSAENNYASIENMLWQALDYINDSVALSLLDSETRDKVNEFMEQVENGVVEHDTYLQMASYEFDFVNAWLQQYCLHGLGINFYGEDIATMVNILVQKKLLVIDK